MYSNLTNLTMLHDSVIVLARIVVTQVVPLACNSNDYLRLQGRVLMLHFVPCGLQELRTPFDTPLAIAGWCRKAVSAEPLTLVAGRIL